MIDFRLADDNILCLEYYFEDLTVYNICNRNIVPKMSFPYDKAVHKSWKI